MRVLGRYVPSEYTPDVIEREFRALPFLAPCCRKERVSVRVPNPLAEAPPAANLAWHQDGGGLEGTTHHMVVWASETPTELRTRDGVERQGEPFDVVWFDNDYGWHKQPTGTNEQTRWFVAIRCSGAV